MQLDKILTRTQLESWRVIFTELARAKGSDDPPLTLQLVTTIDELIVFISRGVGCCLCQRIQPQCSWCKDQAAILTHFNGAK